MSTSNDDSHNLRNSLFAYKFTIKHDFICIMTYAQSPLYVRLDIFLRVSICNYYSILDPKAPQRLGD